MCDSLYSGRDLKAGQAPNYGFATLRNLLSLRASLAGSHELFLHFDQDVSACRGGNGIAASS
jgi:hypothetical protein